MTAICRKSTQSTWVNCIGPFLLLANYVANTVNAVATNTAGGRPPGLFVTHIQWMGGRPFRFSARAGRVGVVLRYMPGRAGGRSIFRPGARGRRPVFDLVFNERQGCHF